MANLQKLDFVGWNIRILADSLKKIGIGIFLIMILDALFYFLAGYLIVVWLQRIESVIASFNLPADVLSLGYERTQQLAAGIKEAYYAIIFLFAVLLIAIIFLASILKGIIWAKTTNTKVTFSLISRFLGLNLLWMGFWFALVFLILWLAEPSAAPFLVSAIIILSLYFTNTLYTLFMKKQELKSIIRAIKLNIAKIHLFLVPYAAMLIVLFAILNLGAFLKFRYYPILILLIFVAYAAVVRYYASALVLEAEKTTAKSFYSNRKKEIFK